MLKIGFGGRIEEDVLPKQLRQTTFVTC